MISLESMDKYEKSGLEGEVFYGTLSLNPSIMFPDGKCFVGDEEESDIEFLKRIERSKQAGRNLFREEWELFTWDAPANALV